MNVNYIKQLESVSLRMADDTRLNSSHVSMYLALFLIWNHHRFENPLSINRTEVMKLSKIGARATYHKCLTELHNWEYLKYMPSHNPLKGSLVNMFIFDTSSEQVESQVPEQLYGHVQSQEQGSSINSLNNRNNKTVKPRKSKTSFVVPELDEIKSFFLSNGSTNSEGENFFNHFESNGWLVGGKSKMKNWQAAARNWISRSEEYAKRSTSLSSGNLNVNQNKDYSVPL